MSQEKIKESKESFVPDPRVYEHLSDLSPEEKIKIAEEKLAQLRNLRNIKEKTKTSEDVSPLANDISEAA